MAYENNEMKFVAVVNRKHSLATILNALAHTAFGLSGKGVNPEHLLDYSNSASGFLAKIDEYPFIILDAKNSNQLQTLVSSVMSNQRIAYNVFTTSMIGTCAEAQLKATREALNDGLDFVVVVLFGAREDVDPLTRKFSLTKGEMP